jgi:hypothetical protein
MMRSQDLRLARHSIESNLDLTVSLLATVSAADELEASEREEAVRILAELEPIHAAESLDEAERVARLAPIVAALERLDDAVNGPLPSEVAEGEEPATP